MKDAPPKNNCAKTELKAKCSSPPAVRNNGLIATWSIAIPKPIRNKEITAMLNDGNSANKKAPAAAIIKAETITFFSLYLSISIPAGIDIKYAMKNENGRNATIK